MTTLTEVQCGICEMGGFDELDMIELFDDHGNVDMLACGVCAVVCVHCDKSEEWDTFTYVGPDGDMDAVCDECLGRHYQLVETVEGESFWVDHQYVEDAIHNCWISGVDAWVDVKDPKPVAVCDKCNEPFAEKDGVQRTDANFCWPCHQDWQLKLGNWQAIAAWHPKWTNAGPECDECFEPIDGKIYNVVLNGDEYRMCVECESELEE